MKQLLGRWATDYSMLFVLLLLCLFFSLTTIDQQRPSGSDAASGVVAELRGSVPPRSAVFVVAGKSAADRDFVAAIEDDLDRLNFRVITAVGASPSVVREQLSLLSGDPGAVSAIVGTEAVLHWSLFENLKTKFPGLSGVAIIVPRSYLYPNFLKAANLKNVAGQSAVFAIIAIGMTLVIITAGIDLSVGSLVALSAVTSALVIRDYFGATGAGPMGMFYGAAVAVTLCGLVGLLSGTMVTLFGMPPFIVTLATMSIARGLAQILSEGQSVYQVPVDFSWIATGEPLGIPNEVVIMIVFYLIAHLMMTRTTLGRWIYAVGGNREAARLSGVPVAAVLLLVYVLCGALAGAGGVLEASRLQSGSPLYGNMYELYVITAVVVGGTSLAGGEGKIFGTLIGALTIAGIRNGMNLMNIESYTQGVVMGALILAAVLIDAAKKKGYAGRLGAQLMRWNRRA
jgi:ribose transport system permease protein